MDYVVIQFANGRGFRRSIPGNAGPPNTPPKLVKWLGAISRHDVCRPYLLRQLRLAHRLETTH